MKPRIKRDSFQTMLEQARRRFRIGDTVREKHTGHIGVVVGRPGEGNAVPSHLYAVKLDDGEIRGVHPLLAVLVKPVDQEDDCN